MRSSSTPTIRGRPACRGSPASCRIGRKRCWSCRASGAPYLVAALSFRVKSWIERVSRVGDVLHTPRIGLKAAQQIAATRADAAVGVVDFDGLAAGIADDLREGGPGLTLHDASALFAALRASCRSGGDRSGGESRRDRAITRLPRLHGETLNAMIATVESEARRLGAEEIYIAAAPDLARDARFKRIEGEAALGKTFALRATVAYKGTWVRLVRSICEAAIAQEAAARFAQAVRIVAERSRVFRLSLLAGRRLPHGAAARSADGIAPRRSDIRRRRARWSRCRRRLLSTAKRCWSARRRCSAITAKRQA